MQLEDLYSEIILDHTRDPRNKRAPGPTGIRVHHHNDLCGDDITLNLHVTDGTVTDLSFEGQGCSISQASASMMTQAVKGLTTSQAQALVVGVRDMMHGKPVPEGVGDIRALEGVKRFPVRIKCALLSWMALAEALGRADQSEGSGNPS